MISMLRLPTHDPMVGRVVGQLLQAAVKDREQERVFLSGYADGEPFEITFQRADQGVVNASGSFASFDIKETYVPARAGGGRGGLFGVASVNDETAARLSGTINGKPVSGELVGRRSASEAKITQDFQETALQGYTVMNLTRQYPAFGGEAVVTFGQPHLQEMTTPGVKTSDDFSLRGTFDATEFAKSLSWRTVSWAQVSCQAVNAPPDGTCVTRFLSHQIGLGKESEIHGNRVTETKTSLELAVDGGAFGRSAPSASASGTLVTEGPAGKIDEQPLIHSYQMDTADNGPVTVKQTYGSNQTHFEIYRLDKDGRKVGLETRTEHVDVGIPFPVKMPRP